MTGNPDDPFERIRHERTTAAGVDASGARIAAAPGDLVQPVPADAPPLPRSWGRALGAPVRQWCYLDANGRVLRWVLRFPKPDAQKGEDGRPREEWTDKEIRAATLRRGEDGRLRWKLKAEPGSRPLYGLDRLAARPNAPVILVEGEKAADAAQDRFPAFVVVTWPGGSNAVAKADFSPLIGRNVVAWPDADDAGRKAALRSCEAALAAGATAARPVSLPDGLPKGWDLADEWPESFGPTHAEAAIQAALAADQADGSPAEWPWGYRMDRNGFWFDAPGKEGKADATWLSAPFDVLGEARDTEGLGWSLVIRFRDRDGREKPLPVPYARLASGGADVRAELMDAGLRVTTVRGKADKFVAGLASVRTPARLTLQATTGWCGDRYVLPAEVVGPEGGEPVIFTGDAGALHYRKAGTLEGWRAGVAAVAEGNDLLTFALSLAFLGPLMRPLELEGGGVHFRGASSSGKTTLVHAAGSVWGGGGPLGFGQTWRATANALEMVAFGHSDGLLVLDELGLIAPEEAGAAAYALAAGQSKGRSRTDGALRRRAEWRVAILSTGEISLADHIRASKRGDRPMAGQELRLLDVEADGGAGMGIWQALHHSSGPANLSDAVKAAAGRDYGHAGPAFVSALISRKAEAIEHAKRILAAFVAKVGREGDTGQARRAAMRFGAIAAAGELATLLDAVPWRPGLASDAAARLYAKWAESFGRDTLREDRAAIRAVREVIESEQASFAAWDDGEAYDEPEPSRAGRDEQARGLKSWGWRCKVGTGLEFRFNSAGWAYVCGKAGLGPAEAARALHEAGFLDKGEGSHWPKRFSRKGVKHRLYAVRGDIVGSDLAGD